MKRGALVVPEGTTITFTQHEGRKYVPLVSCRNPQDTAALTKALQARGAEILAEENSKTSVRVYTKLYEEHEEGHVEGFHRGFSDASFFREFRELVPCVDKDDYANKKDFLLFDLEALQEKDCGEKTETHTLELSRQHLSSADADKLLQALSREEKLCVTRLFLRSNELEQVPEGVRDLRNLKTLGLSSNRIMDLPEWIGDLSKLEKLFVVDNLLERIPSSLEKLDLSTLCLGGNPLKRIKGRFIDGDKAAVALYVRELVALSAEDPAEDERLDCLDFFNKFEVDPTLREYLGVTSERILMFGAYRSGKSHLISTMMSCLLQMYGTFTSFSASADPLTSKVEEHFCKTPHVMWSRKKSKEFPFCFLDTFGMEYGDNWSKMLVDVLNGEYQDKENPDYKKKFGNDEETLMKIDMAELKKQWHSAPCPLYARAVMGVVVVVDGRAIYSQEKGARGKEAGEALRNACTMNHMFLNLGYAPVVVVTNLDKIKDCVLADPLASLEKVESDAVWRVVRDAFARAGIDEGVFPVAPVTSAMESEKVRQVLALRPLRFLLEYRCQRVYRRLLKRKRGEEDQDVVVTGVDVCEDGEKFELYFSRRELPSLSVDGVRRNIAEELGLEVGEVGDIFLRKRAWVRTELLTDKRLRGAGLHQGDRLCFWRIRDTLEFTVVKMGGSGKVEKEVALSLREGEANSLSMLKVRLSQALGESEKDIGRMCIQHSELGGGMNKTWLYLTKRSVEADALKKYGDKIMVWTK